MNATAARSRPVLVEEASRVARPTLRQIFREHGAFVVRVVRHMGVRPGDVEDVAQDVFVVAHRKLDQLDGRGAVRSWLFGIAFRVVWDYRRRARVRREVLTDRLPEGATGGQEAEARAQLADLERALDALNDRERAVFVLYEIEGMPMDEVARSVGCPLFTAYTRLRAARKKVLSTLAADGHREVGDG